MHNIAVSVHCNCTPFAPSRQGQMEDWVPVTFLQDRDMNAFDIVLCRSVNGARDGLGLDARVYVGRTTQVDWKHESRQADWAEEQKSL